MSVKEQAQLQRALKNADPQAVRDTVNPPLSIAAAEMLASTAEDRWSRKPGPVAEIVRAIAPHVDSTARELIALSLVHRGLFEPLGRCVGEAWMPPLSVDVLNALSRRSEQRAEVLLRRWAQNHGVEEGIVRSQLLSASIEDGCYDQRLDFYRAVFEDLPDGSEKLSEGIANNRNACALKALYEQYGPSAVEAVRDHNFAHVMRTARRRVFFERLFRFVDWGEKQLQRLFKQAHDHGSTVLFEACYDVFGPDPIDTGVLTTLFRKEADKPDSESRGRTSASAF